MTNKIKHKWELKNYVLEDKVHPYKFTTKIPIEDIGDENIDTWLSSKFYEILSGLFYFHNNEISYYTKYSNPTFIKMEDSYEISFTHDSPKTNSCSKDELVKYFTANVFDKFIKEGGVGKFGYKIDLEESIEVLERLFDILGGIYKIEPTNVPVSLHTIDDGVNCIKDDYQLPYFLPEAVVPQASYNVDCVNSCIGIITNAAIEKIVGNLIEYDCVKEIKQNYDFIVCSNYKTFTEISTNFREINLRNQYEILFGTCKVLGNKLIKILVGNFDYDRTIVGNVSSDAILVPYMPIVKYDAGVVKTRVGFYKEMKSTRLFEIAKNDL